MVKDFILQHRNAVRARSPPPSPEESEDDEGESGVVVEQPSYIDKERHTGGAMAEEKPVDYSRMNMVDVGCSIGRDMFFCCATLVLTLPRRWF
jgi:hypothetical protein